MAKISNIGADSASTFTADVTTAVNVTTKANHLVYAVLIDNATGLDHYLQMFNAQAADVTLDTTVPDFVVPVKAGSTGGFVLGTMPFKWDVGLSVACTTTATGLTTGSSRVSIVYISG